MAWFSGSVESAVGTCKKNGGLLCIFVRDIGDLSDDLEKEFENPSTLEFLRNDTRILPLRIVKPSSDFAMLNAVYPVETVPALQLINGENGNLILSSHPKNKEELSETLKNGIQAWRSSKGNPSTSESSRTPTVVRNDVAASTEEEKASEQEASSSADPEDIQAKVARLQKKAAEMQKEKQRKAEEEQKEKESQRRRDGQLMVQAERQRVVNLAEQTRIELDKERKADEEHRKKILERIKEDKEERERRRKEQTGSSTETSQVPPKKSAAADTATTESPGVDYTKSRLQFRLEGLDGLRTFTNTFEATQPLQAAFDFVREQTGLGNVTFIQMYPRKEFTKADAKSTLRILGLVPSASLIVSSERKSGLSESGDSSGMVANVAGTFTDYFWFLLQLPTRGLNWIIRMFFPNQQLAAASQQQQSAAQRTNRPATYDESVRRRTGRISDVRADEDRPTYNGNSTQQL